MKNSIYLTTLVNRLKNSPNWAKGDLDAIVISKKPDIQIVITALHNGTEIKSFQSGNSITFHIIEGKLAFYTQNKSIILIEGQLFTLYEKVKYKLVSMEDTVFMLTITNNIVSRKTATRIWARDTGVTVN